MKQLGPCVLTIGLLSGGCALTGATLNLRYDEAASIQGPLSTLPPRRVEVGPFADRREETDKIGSRRTGWGEERAKILSDRPVTEIVRDALATEVVKSGHRAGDDPEFRVSGDVTTFWFDSQDGGFTVEFIGIVGITLNVVDARTGAAVFSRSYQGNYNARGLGGPGTWTQVLNTALERLVHQVVTDARLVQALRQ